MAISLSGDRERYGYKPFALEELATVVERRRHAHFDHESRLLPKRLRAQTDDRDLVGRSPEMEKLYRILSSGVLDTHSALIVGERVR
jgi:DNA-binding NtrC family response regulator